MYQRFFKLQEPPSGSSYWGINDVLLSKTGDLYTFRRYYNAGSTFTVISKLDSSYSIKWISRIRYSWFYNQQTLSHDESYLYTLDNLSGTLGIYRISTADGTIQNYWTYYNPPGTYIENAYTYIDILDSTLFLSFYTNPSPRSHSVCKITIDTLTTSCHHVPGAGWILYVQYASISDAVFGYRSSPYDGKFYVARADFSATTYKWITTIDCMSDAA